MKLSEDIRLQILKAAESEQECCGLIVETSDGLTYLPCRNAAQRPSETFEIGADDWLSAELSGEVAAVVHSHPQGQPFLSGADREMQVCSGLPWVLAVKGRLKIFRCVPHLRGRVFEYGVSDCFTLIRDAYHLCGIDFRDHPRTTMRQDAAADSFVKNLPDGGFYRVADMRPGDVVLTASGGHADHAALFIGNDTVVHHAYNQLSRREEMGFYFNQRIHSVWRHKCWQPEMTAAVLADLEHTQ